ncbi:hypothetical protein EXS73_01705 [Candidatus Pacearchaeota archaeon]|nr:hypothetical protein [Candidatus Pacearchaeota archaeon]
MNTVYFPKVRELRTHKEDIEQKLHISIMIQGKKVTYHGEAVYEYTAELVLQAMAFGFSAKQALQLLEPDTTFKVIAMKHFTRRKDMEEVRGRVIGKEGKTKRTIENISDTELIISNNDIGILGRSIQVEAAIVALGNLIRGTKEANTYAFLERHNKDTKRKRSDLGLKDEEQKELQQFKEDTEDDTE